ncbi:hypothetical protein J4P02_24580 [Pseudomonas sp. NFXW11]|uniref:hypothetical protein n=1 Tax=Pseudomonas sp. NFXW11 TaxID=2819531 RepID=UPI003CF0560D
MKTWKLALIGVVSLSLAACEKQPAYEFEGKYFAAEGDACTTPTNAKDLEQYFLEITKEVQGGSVLYSAKFPSAASAKLPIVSAQSVSPVDNQLTFNFAEAKVSRPLPGNSKFNIVVSVIPNQSKEGHLWLVKAGMLITRDGEVQEYDILDNLRRFIEVGKTGACLRKATAAG